MKRFPLNTPSTIIFSIILGVCLGVIASIYLFAVEVDIPAIPYVNKGVKTNEDITLEQDEMQLRIPKGAQFELVRDSLAGRVYAIYFVIPETDATDAAFEPLPSKPKSFRPIPEGNLAE
jgi:hypothetical protein